MTPSSHELTVATTAAAKMAYHQAAGDEPHVVPFEDLGLQTQNAWREAVLPMVNVALIALPDRLDPVRTLVAHAEENLQSYVTLAPLQTLVKPQD